MAIENIPFPEACKRLLNGSGTSGNNPIPQRTTKLKKAPPRITSAPPADNAKPDMRIKSLGDPVATWTYRTATGGPLGYVARYDDGGKKTIRCWTYGRRSEAEPATWACGHFAAPRPLYNLHLLQQRPDVQVIIVEGEKTADAAARLFPAFVVTTWPGGTESIDRADWSILGGRRVVLIPDHDEPGIKAMQRLAAILHKAGATEIKGVKTGTTIYGEDAEKGWDLADEPSDTPPEMALQWAKQHIFVYPATGLPAPNPTTPNPPEPVETPTTAPEPTDAPPDAESLADAPAPHSATPDPISDELATITGDPLPMATTAKGDLICNTDNAVRAIQLDPALAGHLWYDEFLDAVLTDWQGKTRQWSDADDVKLCVHLQRHVGLVKISVGQAHDAALMAALEDTRNEVHEYFNSLQWDGIERLPHLLSDGFGAEHNAYSQAVGRCWFVGMVARGLNPGCKVDTVPVLEGKQGKKKSTALSVIGGKWFVECHENVMSKDFYGVLTGHLLVEISEMHSFTRAEVERIKGIISCQVDRYRKAYGRHTIDRPRHTVLVGTTNRDDYHKDETGGRRFWPVLCTDISIDWLRTNRDQLWAEAVHRYRLAPVDALPDARIAAGAAWWDIPEDDQLREIDARRDSDVWENAVEAWLSGRDSVQISHLLDDCLNIELNKQDLLLQRRAGRILRALGWTKKVRRDPDGNHRKVWVPED